MSGMYGVSLDLVKAGTITRVEQGSINVTAGTIGTVASVAQLHNAGTIQAGTLGTVAAVGQIHNAGTVAGLPDLPGGTIDMLSAGTVSMINAGTITSVGTVVGVGGTAKVDLATLISGEDQTNDVLKTEQQFSYYHHIGTAGSVSGTVKSAAGFLHTLAFGNHTTGGTYALYDSVGTSGTVVSIITSGAAIAPDILYDTKFLNGLTIVSGSVCDLTISFR